MYGNEGKEETAAVASGMKAAQASRAREHGAAELHEIHVRKASGGYIGKHHYRHADGAEAHSHPQHGSEHVLPSLKHVHEHLDQHFGSGAAGAEAGEQAGEETQ